MKGDLRVVRAGLDREISTGLLRDQLVEGKFGEVDELSGAMRPERNIATPNWSSTSAVARVVQKASNPVAYPLKNRMPGY